MTEDLLIDRHQYLSSGIHIGMILKSKDMEKFIYKVRPNGLAVLNIGLLDQRIRIAAKYLAGMTSILVVSRKENGQLPVKMFAKAAGFICSEGRFMPGSLTNPKYEKFFEPDAVLLTDPASDKQVLKEALKMRIPIIALCDTFNSTSFVDFILPCNNKGKKSLALIYWILAREICNIRGTEFSYTLADFGYTEDGKKGEKQDDEE